MSWFRVSAQRLAYRGRITRDPFTRWMGTQEGLEAVRRTAGGIRFSLLGRRRAAIRRLWRPLESAARSDSLAQAIQGGAEQFMRYSAEIAYALSLPRVSIALHRLVVVPRALVAGRARAALHERLRDDPALRECDAAVRSFFLDRLVAEMDAAIASAAPSPRRPVEAHEQWACVGITSGVIWIDRLWSGADAAGHVFMYEMPRKGLARRERKAIEAAIQTLNAQVTGLPRAERGEMLRIAASR